MAYSSVDRPATMVSVALPVLDGAERLDAVLRAVRMQRLDREIELLVCDSGSRDGSVKVARHYGARVLQIRSSEFGHGTTRNLLMREARGDHVALLTQDAEPVADTWLAELLAGFAAADNVGLVYGPYRPRPEAHSVVAWELEAWFRSLSPEGQPRVDRLAPDEIALPGRTLFGRRTFFTDANACISRRAWEQIPFRPLAYTEDQALALDMLRAGYAKVFAPDAPVWHSHEYKPLQEFRRAFDEWRGLHEVYGWCEPADLPRILSQLRGRLGAQRRMLATSGVSPARRGLTMAAATRHHVLRLAGALLGSRADRLPPAARRWCSLERRADRL